MLNKKPILSIETSQSICGAGIYFDDKKYFETYINLKNSHAEKIFEVVDTVLKLSGVQLDDLESIAVSAGPGSFTGLRIGMSAAKGMAFGISVPIIPVPTFEALALQISNVLPENTNFIIANNVNSEELYFAEFKVIANSYIFVQNLTIKKSCDLYPNQDVNLYGNASINSKFIKQFKNLSSPSPQYVAKWASINGEDKLVYDYDLLEPNYLKEFKIKGK